MKTTGKRLTREYPMLMAYPARDIFPLLCPVREYEWIPHWRCRLVHSQSGHAELGCVFQTDFTDDYGLETWVVSRYEKEKEIAFVRTGEHRTTRYTISLTPTAGGTTLLWRQEITALTPRGEELLGAVAESGFTAMMRQLEELLNRHLDKGHARRGKWE